MATDVNLAAPNQSEFLQETMTVVRISLVDLYS